MIFRLKLSHHDASIKIINSIPAILRAGHLYNAAHQEQMILDLEHSHLSNHWLDMDMMLAMHGQNAFFFGSRTENPGDYLKQHCLANGLAISQLLREARSRKGPLKMTGKGKCFQTLAPVSFMLEGRIFYERWNLGPADVEKIIPKSKGKKSSLA